MLRLKNYQRAIAAYSQATGLTPKRIKKHAKHRMRAVEMYYAN